MSKIIMIYPTYVDGYGDCTVEVTKGYGEQIIYKPISIVMKEAKVKRLIDSVAYRKKIKDIIGRNRNYPLFLTKHEMLVPMKVRLSKIDKDSCYGYINEQYVKRIYGGVIHVKDFGEIDIIENDRTFNKRMEDAKKIRREFYSNPILAMIYGMDKNSKEDLKEELMKIIEDIK